MATPALNPNQSFTVTDEPIGFDPSQPFDLEVDEVTFDPSQPFEAEPETGGIEGVAKSAARGALSEGFLSASEGVYRAGAATVRPFDRDAYLNQEIASAESEIQSLLNNKMMISDAREAGIRGQQERIDRANLEMQARLTPGTPEFNERQSVESATSTGIADTLTGFADEAKGYREAVREALPISQNFQESLTGQVAQGLGQLITVPAYAVPGLGQAVSIGQLYQEAYDDAVNSGANLEQAERAAFQYTAGAAPLEILADKLLVGKALKGMSGKLTIGQAAKEVAKMSVQEGATEGAQQALLNVVANNLTGYDPDRPLDDGVIQSVIVAGLVGAGGATVAQGAGYLSRDTQNQPSSIPKLPVDETSPDANSGFNRMKRAINNDPERFQELYGEAGRQAAETFAKPSLRDWRNSGTSAAETVKQEKVTTLDAAAVNANENSSPLVAQELSKQADTLQSTPAPIVAPEAAEIDRQARTLEILEDLDQGEAGLQTEVQSDERFAPPEPSNVIRQAQIEADNLYSEDPDQVGQSSLRDWRLTLPPEVAGNIQAHGAPISELQGILEKGIDQSRPFYTAPLNESGESSLGLRDIGTGGQVLVLGAPGQDIKQSGAQAVVVNDYLAPSVTQLQEAYPNVTWLTTQNATQWLNEQQPTRLDEPITIPQGKAQAPETGIAPEVQENPATQQEAAKSIIGFHGTRNEFDKWDSGRGGLINLAFEPNLAGVTAQEQAERYARGAGGGRASLNYKIDILATDDGNYHWSEEEQKFIPDNELPNAPKSLTIDQANSLIQNLEAELQPSQTAVMQYDVASQNPLDIRTREGMNLFGEALNTINPESLTFQQRKWLITLKSRARRNEPIWDVTKWENRDKVFKDAVIPALKQAGYDGLIYGDDSHSTFAVFDPEQLTRINPNATQTIQQQEGVQGERAQGNQIRTQPETGGSNRVLSETQEQVNEPARNDSGSIPETLQPTVEEGTGEPSQVAPRATPRRVQIGSSPQTHEVIEELPKSQREQELGERYFRIRNERTGEEQTVEAGDMRPVKGKVAEDAIKPEVDQTKERLNTLTPAQKESVLSLNNNSGSVLIPDFQDLQQAVQNIASSLNQAYDNFTDWSGAMVRSFGNDIVRFLQRIYNILNTGGIDYLPGRENSGSILNPAGMFSKSTRQPFRKVQKDKKYKPEGVWSAAGKWNKQIFDFLGQKERNVSANLNVTEFLAAKLQRERRKAEKEGIDISTETLNTALGNTDNRLTDAQYAQARQISNPQARANFERTAKLQNYAIARQAQAAALQSLPQDIQETINEMRNRVDQLSSELRDSGAVSGDIKASIDDAMGLYLHRSYSIFDNAEGWKNFIYSDDPEAVAIRNRAETLFQDYARAEAASQLIRENKEAGTPITRQEAIDQVKDLDVTEEAGLILEDYLSVADKGEQSILGGRIVGQKNRSILKMRGQIPEEIQDLWGEQKDATANFAKTYAGMSSFLENHRFLENVLQEGLITEQNPDGYIWKEGESPSNRPRAYTQLVGDGSKSMEPLNGAWMPPELAQAFTEYYGKRGDQNAVLRILQAATGLSMKSKTAYSLASTIRNFVGNIAFMTANGNFNISKLSDAQKSAWSNLTKGGEKAIRDRIENYIRLGVVGDNVGPSLIKEISEAANIEKTGDKLTQGNPILTKVWRGLKAVDRKATDIYSSVDDFWKVFAFENELNKIKRAYPNETQAQQEQRAANVVRSTVPTYSLAPEIVRNLKSNFGVAVAPFITFTTEVIRTTYNTVRQSITEIREGNATNNQELRNIGIQRLASFLATQSIFPSLGIIFKELFDYDDEDEDAVRRFLPDWQKNAQLLLLPPDEKGNPRYIDVSFLDPYGYLKEPLIAAAVQSRSGKSTDQIALDASLASLRQIAEPFISEQILAGSIADIARNTTASGAEVYNPQDNIANIAGKAALHVASSFEPGTFTSLNRIYKGVTEQVSPTGRAYDTPSELSSLFLGQRVSSLDPQTSLDFASRRFKGENQDSTSLFTRPFKSRGTIGENAVSEGYQSANEAKQRNVQSLRDAYKAALTLGVPEKTARRILDDASIGQDAMREVISGVYRRYQPSTQSMNEVRKKNPERIQQLQQAISSTPATVPLR